MKSFLEKENTRLFIGYVFFAGFAALIDLGVLYFLTETIKLWYFYSAGASYILGMIINYALNKYFNFANKSKRTIIQFTLFFSVALTGLILNQLIIYVIVEFTGLHYLTAKIISLIIVMFWSFYGHKKITFGIIK